MRSILPPTGRSGSRAVPSSHSIMRRSLTLRETATRLSCVCSARCSTDTFNDCLQVFSLAGQHRRSITGEWQRPGALCFVKDRLYLVERAYDADNPEYNHDPKCGTRIIVLSLQGDILQFYRNPVEGQTFDGRTLCYFDGKLLATLNEGDVSANVVNSVMALAGA